MQITRVTSIEIKNSDLHIYLSILEKLNLTFMLADRLFKERKAIIVGSRGKIIFDDINNFEKIKVIKKRVLLLIMR